MMVRRFAAAMAALVLGGCQRVTTVEVTPAALSLAAAGQSVSLAVRVLDQDGTPMKGLLLGFSSSSPEVATADPAGNVKAVRSGKASIEVTAGEKKAVVPVEVRIPAKLTVSPGGVGIMGIGGTVELRGEVADDAGQPIAGAVVTYTSTDERIARVTGNVVTSVATGMTKIKASYGTLAQEVSISVAPPEPAAMATIKK